MKKLGLVITILSITLVSKAQNIPGLSQAQSYVEEGHSLIFEEKYHRIVSIGHKAWNAYEEANEEDPLILASIYNLLATGYYYKSKQDSFFIYSDRAIDLLNDHQNSIHLAYAYLIQGRQFLGLTDHEKGLQYLEKSLSIALDNLGPEHPDMCIYYHVTGICYIFQFKTEKAIEFFRKARKAYLKKFGELHLTMIHIDNDIAVAHREMGEYDKALSIFQKAVEVSKVVGQYNTSTISLYSEIGELHQRKSECDKAVPYYVKSLELMEKDIKNTSPADFAALNARAMVCSYFLGDYEEADRYYYTALEKLNYNTEEPNKFAQVTEMLFLNFLLHGRINRYHDLYQKTKAPDLLDTLDQVNELVLSMDAYFREHQTSGGEGFHYSSANYVFESAIATNLYKSKPNIDIAFSLAEKDKGRSMLANARLANAKKFAGISESLQKKEDQLNNAITKFENKLYYAEKNNARKNNQIIKEYRDSLFQLRRSKDGFIELLEADYSDYYRLKYDFSTIRVESLQQKLSPNEAIIEYFVGEYITEAPQIYIFLITSQKVIVESVPLDFPLEEWIQKMRKSIYSYWAAPGQADSVYLESNQTFCRFSHQLYGKLIQPIDSHLTPKLLIIPDGVLHLLPFDALLTEPVEDPSDFQSRAYLIEDHTVSYDYSATIHWSGMKRASNRGNKFMGGFAPSFKGAGEKGLALRSVEELRGELTSLKYNKEELERLSTIFQSDLFVDSQASKQTFLDQANNYSILHLATHGKANDEVGDFSFIAFSDPKDSLDNSGKLFVRELYNLKLNTDLVVLSACETGLGEVRDGEGVISISRGFSYAGAKSIITTLWSIQDHPTTVSFMESFYEKLKGGLPKDEALRATKLEVLKNPTSAAPFFWAGFIPFGDMAPIKVPNQSEQWYWLLGIAALIMIMFAVWNFRKSK